MRISARRPGSSESPMPRPPALLKIALAFCLLICWQCWGFADCPQCPDRIAGPIAKSPKISLLGNQRATFQPENDQGPVADSFQLENLTLMFKLTESQHADLIALLEEQQNPTSPQYHQWLTPEQYADRFGLSQNDVKQIAAWLEAQGFTIVEAARGRDWIAFSGTAAQVRAAFQTEIHNYSIHGRTYFANASEPSIPAAMADMVRGIQGLDNYPLQPRGVFRQISAEPQPNFTSNISENTFVAPADFAVIYDLQNLYNAGIDGTGQSIAIMGQTDLYNNGADVAAFRSASGLPPNQPQVILIPGASDPGVVSTDIDEASLDVEWAGAIAKNATIYYVNGGSGGVFNAFRYAVNNKTAPVISVSYGACEPAWEQNGDLQSMESLIEQASSQGQTVVAASGDSGAADCDYSTNPNSPVTIATQGLAVDFPASSPYVTAMGGSEFNEGAGDYWQAATTATGDVLTSALSYIPEMAWNDTSSRQNTSHQLLAGGGGASAVFTKPAWQTGTSVPTDNARDVPDLSFNASSLHDTDLICAEGKCVNGYRNSDQTVTVAGGTSAAAPTFAGIVVLINQQMKTPGGQGNLNPTLYSMAQSAPAAFHDITTGSNIVPCQVAATDPGCPAGGRMGYQAAAGYDLATGLGSVDAFNLVMEWKSSGAGNLPAPTLTAPANGASGVMLSPAFTWSAVTGNNGYRILIATNPADLPTNPATTACSGCVIADSSATNSYFPATPLAVGLYFWEVQALEPTASSGTAAWSAIFSFTVGSSLPAPTLTAPSNGATGVSLPPTLTWSAVAGSAGYRILIATTQSALPTNPSAGVCGGCSAGVTTSSATYAPSATALAGGTTFYWEVQALAASGGLDGTWSGISTFATAASDFSLSASPNSLTISPGSSGNSTLTLTPINNFSATPTFTCTASSSLAGVTCSVGALTNNAATVTVTASSTATTRPWFQHRPRFNGWCMALAALLCLWLFALHSAAEPQPETCHGHPGRAQARAGRPWHSFVVVGLLLASISCGGGSSGMGTPHSTAESGTVTITGISSGTSHTATISVSVS